MFRFWDDFLTKVLDPLKLFISATRHGLWDVYQSAKAEFLPLLFAANRSIYTRYMPVMLLLMNRLPPEVKIQFEDKQFVAKLSRGKFNAVWLDYALEATENKNLKGTGGIIGLTLKGTALVRWFMSRPVTAQYSVQQRINTNANQGNSDQQ